MGQMPNHTKEATFVKVPTYVGGLLLLSSWRSVSPQHGPTWKAVAVYTLSGRVGYLCPGQKGQLNTEGKEVTEHCCAARGNIGCGGISQVSLGGIDS